jgi:hypothetical protein
LANFINQHGSVYVVDGKEAHVFDHPQYQDQQDKQAFVERHYQNKLKHYQQQPIICDATPITIYHPAFLAACYQYNKQAKFILILRDPVQRAISHYQMSKARGTEKRSMLMAFLLEPLRLFNINKHLSWGFSCPFREQSYLSRGCYTPQLSELFALIPKEQILVLSQEALKDQHTQVMEQVWSFLGVADQATQSKKIFPSKEPPRHWADSVAKLYARLYFLVKSEKPSAWQKIMDARQDQIK